jgi:hypothetical protein
MSCMYTRHQAPKTPPLSKKSSTHSPTQCFRAGNAQLTQHPHETRKACKRTAHAHIKLILTSFSCPKSSSNSSAHALCAGSAPKGVVFAVKRGGRSGVAGLLFHPEFASVEGGLVGMPDSHGVEVPEACFDATPRGGLGSRNEVSNTISTSPPSSNSSYSSNAPLGVWVPFVWGKLVALLDFASAVAGPSLSL